MIDNDQIALLNTSGIGCRSKDHVFSDEEGWHHKFKLLCAFQRDHGHCRVPCNLVVDYVNLGPWVNDQRQLFKNRFKGKTCTGALITDERIALLNAKGFEWNWK